MARMNKDGTLSGKIGSTLQRSVNGVTYITSRPDEVKNPQTDMQMAQRSKMQNIVNLYGCMKPALKDNFQDKEGKQSDYNRFVGCNLSQHPIYLTQSEAAVKACIIAPYIVAHGTLGSLEYHLEDGWLVTDINVGNLQITAETKMLDLASSILTPLSGWLEGDLLEFIACKQVSKNSRPFVEMEYATLELDPTNKNDISRYLGGIELKVNEDDLLCMKAEGDGGYAVVRKRISSKGIFTSVQKMVVSNSALDAYSSRDKMREAVDSYLTTKNKKKREKGGTFLVPDKTL